MCIVWFLLSASRCMPSNVCAGFGIWNEPGPCAGLLPYINDYNCLNDAKKGLYDFACCLAQFADKIATGWLDCFECLTGKNIPGQVCWEH